MTIELDPISKAQNQLIESFSAFLSILHASNDANDDDANEKDSKLQVFQSLEKALQDLPEYSEGSLNEQIMLLDAELFSNGLINQKLNYLQQVELPALIDKEKKLQEKLKFVTDDFLLCE